MEVLLQLQHPLDLLLSPFLISSQSLKQMKVSTHKEIISWFQATYDILNLGKYYEPGELIFEDNFDTLNSFVWEHEISLAGGGNWEFQFYTHNRTNR